MKTKETRSRNGEEARREGKMEATRAKGSR